jgi:outer membrane protein TolC
VLRSVNEKLRGIRVKYERGVAKEFDLLTAQLDSLQQEGQIQALLMEQRRLKLTLLRLIGRPTETDIALSGQVEPFPMGLEEAVALALREDVQARQLREDVGEKLRERREAGLAYLPDVRFQMGIQNGWGVTSLDLSKSPQGRTWLVDLSSRLYLSRTAPIPQDPRFFDRDRNRFAAFQVSAPLFAGFQRYGQAGAARERLHQAQTTLRDREDEVERRVRELYQNLRVQTVRLEIGAHRLRIARRRLEIQERLRDLAQVTDLQVETFRNQFFSEQEQFFQTQDAYINALEDLRQAIGYFD